MQFDEKTKILPKLNNARASEYIKGNRVRRSFQALPSTTTVRFDCAVRNIYHTLAAALAITTNATICSRLKTLNYV